MAPDVGTTSKRMAWMMDTYSAYVGSTVPASSRATRWFGRSLGRREGHGRGVGYLINRAMDVLGLKAERCTAVVQGFGNVGSITAFSLAKVRREKSLRSADASGGATTKPDSDLRELEKHVTKRKASRTFPAANRLRTNGCSSPPCGTSWFRRRWTANHLSNAAKIQCRISPKREWPDYARSRCGHRAAAGDFHHNPTFSAMRAEWSSLYFEWVQDLQSFFGLRPKVMGQAFRILEGASSQAPRRSPQTKDFHAHGA